VQEINRARSWLRFLEKTRSVSGTTTIDEIEFQPAFSAGRFVDFSAPVRCSRSFPQQQDQCIREEISRQFNFGIFVGFTCHRWSRIHGTLPKGCASPEACLAGSAFSRVKLAVVTHPARHMRNGSPPLALNPIAKPQNMILKPYALRRMRSRL